MKQKPVVLFLYTELAEYFLSCLRELIRARNYEVHLVRWPINKEAPFDFKFPDKLNVYNRKELNDSQLLDLALKINPDLIYCSGWVDKGYLHVAKKFKKKIPVILGLDNQWEGNFRQRIAALLSFRLVKPYFNCAWVPGVRQKKYAQMLGFSDENIQLGFYSADVNHFSHFYKTNREKKNNEFPKRFIYVGRYLEFKGIFEMWNAFIELQNENPNEWELWCLGTGDLFDKRVEHEKIKHFGFVQPNEIERYIAETGVFILPSKFEPWGVVVHEFAACGFPLICSDKVGAAQQFLEETKNGFFVDAGDKSSIKSAMKKMMSLSNEELNEMSVKSTQKANEISPQTWVLTIDYFLQDKLRKK